MKKSRLKEQIEDYYGKKIKSFEKYDCCLESDLLDGYVHEESFEHRNFINQYESRCSSDFDELMFPFIRDAGGQKVFIPTDAYIIEFENGGKDVFRE